MRDATYVKGRRRLEEELGRSVKQGMENRVETGTGRRVRTSMLASSTFEGSDGKWVPNI